MKNKKAMERPVKEKAHFMCPLCKTHQYHYQIATIGDSAGYQKIYCYEEQGGCGATLFANIQWDVRFKNIYTLQEHDPEGRQPLGLT